MFKELEQIEETYRTEIFDLKQTIHNVNCENRHLSSLLPGHSKTNVASGILYLYTHGRFAAMRDEDLVAIVELREESAKQREQIRELQHDIDRYACEIDNVIIIVFCMNFHNRFFFFSFKTVSRN
jgi:hypothetical protein